MEICNSDAFLYIFGFVSNCVKRLYTTLASTLKKIVHSENCMREVFSQLNHNAASLFLKNIFFCPAAYFFRKILTEHLTY